MKKEKIIVCHVVNRLGIGGMENGVINICNGLDRLQFAPAVCCLEDPGLMATRLRHDVVLKAMDFEPGRGILRALQLACYLKELKPHVVHTHSWGAGALYGIIGAWLARVPVIINGEHGRVFNKPRQVIVQYLLSCCCDAILSVSEDLRRKVVAELHIGHGRIRVINNGVDTSLFAGRERYTDSRKKLLMEIGCSWHADDFIIGSVGSLKPQKNQMLLLRAIEELNTRELARTTRVVFVGDGGDREALLRHAQNHGLGAQVSILGQRDDVPELLAAFDCLVSTSIGTWEGFSNVILEGMSSGIPVVATHSFGTSDMIRDGKTGFIIKAEDVTGLSRRLECLLDNATVAQTIGNNARQFVTQYLSLDKMVTSYQQTYQSLVGRVSGSKTLPLRSRQVNHE